MSIDPTVARVITSAISRMERFPRYKPLEALHDACAIVEDEAFSVCFPERVPTDREDAIRMMREHLAEALGVPA